MDVFCPILKFRDDIKIFVKVEVHNKVTISNPYAVFSDDTSLWTPLDRFSVEEQAVVADGFCDPATSRLCLSGVLGSALGFGAIRYGKPGAGGARVRDWNEPQVPGSVDRS